MDTGDPRDSRFLERVHEIIQTREGLRGDFLDKAITYRDLLSLGLITKLLGGNYNGVVVSLPGPPGPQGPPGPSITPDLGVPPGIDTSAIVVTAGLSHIYVEWPAQVYTEGHGPGYVEVWAAQYSGSGPLPVYGDAKIVSLETGVFFAFPAPIHTQVHFWLRNVTNDGVAQATPSGGANGKYATTGLIGSSDLGTAIVLAQNLASNSVTSDKANLEIGGDNLLANNSFEVDADSSGIGDGWAGYYSTGSPTYSRPAGRISGVTQRITWTGANADRKGFYAGSELGGGVRGGWQANKTYVVSFYARAGAAHAAGNGCELAWDTAPSTTVILKNPDVSTSWQRYAFRVTHGGSPQANGRVYMTCKANGGQTGYMEFDDVQVEEGETLTGYSGKLAVNTIVAGDGVIGNLAILNAMLGNAVVDDAKVANLSAAKISVGDGTIGGLLKSSNFVANTSGWRVLPNGQAEFNDVVVRGTVYSTNGVFDGQVTIRDSGSNVIFGSGATVNPSSYMAVPTGWLNSQISISPNGTLNGAGGGTVSLGSLSGVGAFAFLNVLNNGNLSTYMAGAAIDLAFINTASIANLAAIKALTGTLSVDGTLTIGTGGKLLSGQSAYDTGTGICIEYNGGTPRLSLGSSTKALLWDGSNLTLRGGSLSATGGTFSGTLTADAIDAVDTINLKGNSVTVPAFTSAASAFALNSSDQQVLGPSASIDPGSGSVAIILGVDYEDGATASEGTDVPSSPTFTIKRGSTVLVTWTPPVGGRHTTYEYKDTPGGSATYSLFVQGHGGATQGSVYRRTMLTIGTKR